jgi:hypothetical protein
MNSGLELLVADSDNDRIRYVSSSDHASMLALAAVRPSVRAPLGKRTVTVAGRKRRIRIVRDVAMPVRLSRPARLTLTIRTKRGRLVTTVKATGGPDVVGVHLPARLRSGKHRLTKDHYVVGVTAKAGSASASSSLELVVK